MKWKLAASVGALLIGFVVISWTLAEAKVRKLEGRVAEAKQQAGIRERESFAAESAAAEYRRKIEYLESELAAIGQIARRQDEELEKMGVDVGAARRDVERAQSIRAIDATADELCSKLAELGHGC